MVAYSFKERFVQPIQVGLRHAHHILDAVPGLVAPKRQTIRAIGKRRHARPGEILQLYYGMRTKQCMSIGVARCTRVRWITIWVGLDDMIVQIEDVGKVLGPRMLKAFAQADGFDDAKDMATFWRREHRAHEIKFDGKLIEWEPIRG